MSHPIAAPDNSQDRPRRKRKRRKPDKPYPEFPLFSHHNGMWAAKIRGELHYFGSWKDDRKGVAALKKYGEEKDDLHAGKTPRAKVEGTVRDLVNKFLTFKRNRLATGYIAAQTFQDYYLTCELIIESFGRYRLLSDIAADDFERLHTKLAKVSGPVRTGNTIQRVRSVFKYGFDSDLIEKPIKFGPGFKRPSKKDLRIERAKNGKKLFEAKEIHRMLKKAGVHLRAMILLGVNCGLGNTDCGSLEFRHLDLDGGWLDFPRPKTGVPRKAKLWEQTVQAIKKSLAKRPKPKVEAHAKLIFLTQRGAPWVKVSVKEIEAKEEGKPELRVFTDDSVSKETKKMMKALGLNFRRGFYTLRHTFRTKADGCKDQPAIDLVMGHESPHMSSVYREEIEDDRLVAVAEQVQRWLFPDNEPKKEEHPSVIPMKRARA